MQIKGDGLAEFAVVFHEELLAGGGGYVYRAYNGVGGLVDGLDSGIGEHRVGGGDVGEEAHPFEEGGTRHSVFASDGRGVACGLVFRYGYALNFVSDLWFSGHFFDTFSS